MNNRRYDQELRRRAEQERIRKNIFLIYCIAVTLLLIAILLFTLALSKTISGSGYTYSFAGEDVKYKKDEMLLDGIQYVDMDKVAEMCSMEKDVGENEATYSVNGTKVTFIDGESEIEVNSIAATLSGKAFVSDEKCLVPLWDVSKILPLVEVRENSTKVALTLISNEKNVYIMMSKNLKIEYLNDMSEYDKYIQNNDKNSLILANKTNIIGQSYEPKELTNIPKQFKADKELQLAKVAERALVAMMTDARSAGISDCYVTSAYRSYAYQQSLFNYYVELEMGKGLSREEAEAKVLTYSARPGESEHQTGLCVDFTTASIGGVVEEIFEETKAFDWLVENCWKYGFILRYPKDKTNVTGYDYEPWHYRFVGLEAASAIHQSGMCFEEYLEYVK